MTWKPTTIPGRPPKPCVDCVSETEADQLRPSAWRPTDHAPLKPRCSSHQRAERTRQRSNRKERYQERVYGLTPAEHTELLAFQDGRCWICRTATGRTKALATDHDHSCCPGDTSCGECVRGKLCGKCNYNLIGMFSIEQLIRAMLYLQGDTPMKRLRELKESA